MSNVEKYDKAFIESFSIEKKALKDLEYNKIDQWDSIGHMSLIADLEDKFKITFETDDEWDPEFHPSGKLIVYASFNNGISTIHGKCFNSELVFN